MPVLRDNLLTYEIVTEIKSKPVSAIKVILDVLDNCEHSCSGCYVNRRNNACTDDELMGMCEFIEGFTSNGILLDEIAMGPTDFLSSSNLYAVLKNPHVLKMLNRNSSILLFTSPLAYSSDNDIDEFCDFVMANINDNTEIEISIPMSAENITDLNFIQKTKEKIDRFDCLPHGVTYVVLLNMELSNDVDYEALHKSVMSHFGTTMDLIPSIARSKNKNKLKKVIDVVNEYFNQLPVKNSANNVMVDHAHAGPNYKTLSFKKGEWFIAPFLYENMTINDEIFRVDDIDEVHRKMVSQYSRANKVCSSCEFLPSCCSRGIIMLIDYLDTDKCICPKVNMRNHLNVFDKTAMKTYNWDGYTVDLDKNGYRKKFYDN